MEPDTSRKERWSLEQVVFTMLADTMGIEDFSLMRDDFRLSDRDAQIFVQISGENVTVCLLNPIKELEKYGTVNQIDVSLP